MFDGLFFYGPKILLPTFIILNIYGHSAYSHIYIYIYILHLWRPCLLLHSMCRTQHQSLVWPFYFTFSLTNHVPYAVCVCYDLLPNSTFLAPMIRWLSPSNRKLQQMFAQSRFVLHITKILRTKKLIFSMPAQYLSFHDVNVRGASVPAALEVRALAMLSLRWQGIESKVLGLVQRIIFRPLYLKMY